MKPSKKYTDLIVLPKNITCEEHYFPHNESISLRFMVNGELAAIVNTHTLTPNLYEIDRMQKTANELRAAME